jgi:hypothetical protein
LTEFIGIASFSDLCQLIAVSYLLKLILNPILLVPAMFLTSTLKNLEGINVYDKETNFNPFKLYLEENDIKNINKLAIKES